MEIILICKYCKIETLHIDRGVDIRPDKRYYCKVCGKYNEKE